MIRLPSLLMSRPDPAVPAFVIGRGQSHSMQISDCCAQFLPPENQHDFICRVDAALYAAKRNGRNRSEVAADTLEQSEF
jgi:PleD family two-component response regulator